MGTISDKLNADLDRDAVRTRKQAGFDLSYVDGFYVFDQMNQIFGNGNWGYEVASLLSVNSDIDGKGRTQTSMECLVKLWVYHPELPEKCVIMDVGHGHGIHKDPGQARESASKEAVTDAVKRCCRVLGRRVGLALYDKDQRYVSTKEQRSLDKQIRDAKTLEQLEELRDEVKANITPKLSALYKAKKKELLDG